MILNNIFTRHPSYSAEHSGCSNHCVEAWCYAVIPSGALTTESPKIRVVTERKINRKN